MPCSLCKNGIKFGNVAYHCILCPNLFLCEKCEDEKGHQHNMIKGRCGMGPMDPVEKNKMEMELQGQSSIEDAVLPGASFTKTWSLINTGKKSWPNDTIIFHVSGVDLKGKFSEFGEVLPKKNVDVVGFFVAPNKPGKYREIYKLIAFGKNFGPEIEVEVLVKPEELKIPEEYRENFNQLNEMVPGTDPKKILELLEKHKK